MCLALFITVYPGLRDFLQMVHCAGKRREVMNREKPLVMTVISSFLNHQIMCFCVSVGSNMNSYSLLMTGNSIMTRPTPLYMR